MEDRLFKVFNSLVRELDKSELRDLQEIVKARLGNIELARRAGVAVSDDEMALLKKGRRFDAIKSFRLRTRCGLLEAKNVMDATMEEWHKNDGEL